MFDYLDCKQFVRLHVSFVPRLSSLCLPYCFLDTHNVGPFLHGTRRNRSCSSFDSHTVIP